MNHTVAAAKSYSYIVEAGAPRAYEMVYDFDHNYLTDAQGRPLLHFTSVGKSPGGSWGSGYQATSASANNPLPHGVHVRWFSVAENQFWEGECTFDQNFLQSLVQHQIYNLFKQQSDLFSELFGFVVYVAPGGVVTVWVGSGAEQYFVAQFRAQKVEEDNWNDFIRKALALQFRSYTREEYVQRRLSDAEVLMGTQTAVELQNGTFPWDGIPWKRRMQTYDWQLVGDEHFTMLDYWAWYTNGEKLFTYADDTHPRIRLLHRGHAVPYFLSLYAQSTVGEKKLNRININFDENEMMDAFERFAALEPIGGKIELQIQVSPDYKNIAAFIVKGEQREELNITKAALQDLYRNTGR